jgi:hypothetical protein
VEFRNKFVWLAVPALALCLNNGCYSSANPPKTVLLCGFENLSEEPLGNQPLDPPVSLKKPSVNGDDFGWSTGGYVALTPWNKFASQGKWCAQARFTVPADFKGVSETARLTSWEAGMTLSPDTATKLAATDWSPYGVLAVDFYNPDPVAYQAFLRITDSHSNTTTPASTP